MTDWSNWRPLNIQSSERSEALLATKTVFKTLQHNLLEGTLPRAALPRWNACQRYLIDRLLPLGADPQAKDASRVLRTVHTTNSKSGEICRVVHVETAEDGKPVRYDFEYLAELLLPVARWEIEQQRRDRIERRQLRLIRGDKNDNLRGFSGRQLRSEERRVGK